MAEAGTLTRFELYVIVRNQVKDRGLVRRALAVEAAMEELAPLVDEDVALAAMVGLGAGIDAELVLGNPGRRGQVAEELLRTEGAPAPVCAAARERVGPVEGMARLAALLVGAEGLVDEVFAELEGAEAELEGVEPFAIAHRLERAARKRGDEDALRVLAALDRVGLEARTAAERVVAGMRRVRSDLRL